MINSYTETERFEIEIENVSNASVHRCIVLRIAV